jgi:uncharacterized protein YggU (UPF0235/DUF167 family)
LVVIKDKGRVIIKTNKLIYMYIKIRVVPGSRKETFEEVSKDHFKIWVKEKAERNQANRRVVEVIADYFKLTPNKVRIISGHYSPGKILSLDL